MYLTTERAGCFRARPFYYLKCKGASGDGHWRSLLRRDLFFQSYLTAVKMTELKLIGFQVAAPRGRTVMTTEPGCLISIFPRVMTWNLSYPPVCGAVPESC